MTIKYLACIALALTTSAAHAQQVAVPSGMSVTLFDVILEPDTRVARFRFLVPAIGGTNGVSFATTLPDIQFLCDDVVIPGLAQNDWTNGDVVISLSAQKTAFGVVSPDVVQYFQPFSIQAGACIWEDF